MTGLPSGTVTFLFTDLEESTRLWDQFPEEMRDALARHDELLRAGIERNRGTVVKTTGDGVYAVFTEAPDAVAAATHTMRSLHAERWGATGPLRARMALHTGSAHERDGDYFGPALNRASRLMSAAHGGQVVLSQVCAELVRDHPSAGLELRDLGEHRFRGLARPEQVFELLIEGMPTEHPPLQSLDARPGVLELPWLPQAEGIAFSPDGRSLLIGSSRLHLRPQDYHFDPVLIKRLVKIAMRLVIMRQVSAKGRSPRPMSPSSTPSTTLAAPASGQFRPIRKKSWPH